MANWKDFYDRIPSGPGSGYINMLEGYGQQYMDPTSSYNMGQFNRLKSMGQESANAMYGQGKKMMAAGQNPFANEQFRAQQAQGTDSAMGGYLGQQSQNQQMGQGMLGMGMQARTQMSGQQQQQAQMNREYKQHERGQILGLAGTLGSAALIGGGLGTLGGALGKMSGNSHISPQFVQGPPVNAPNVLDSTTPWALWQNPNKMTYGDPTARGSKMFADDWDTGQGLFPGYNGVTSPSALSISQGIQQQPQQSQQATAFTPEQEMSFRKYMTDVARVPSGRTGSLEQLIKLYNSWKGNNFQWGNW